MTNKIVKTIANSTCKESEPSSIEMQSSSEQAINETKTKFEVTLWNLSEAYNLLRKIEQSDKWFLFRQDTLEYIFKKFPSMSVNDFEKFFLQGIYNKNILRNSPEVIDYLELDNITPWSDLIEIIIEQICLSENDFNELINDKIDVITIPNMVTTDVAQGYFKEKLQYFLPDTKVIFWDMEEIKDNIWYNQVTADSVWFYDILWNSVLNSCLFKLFKTEPNNEKLKQLNNLFENIQQDIFLWWSTFVIPFETPENLTVIKMPKMEVNSNDIELGNNWILLNSMWYLNSAYYADKVKWSFVLWSHNIAEPMHAWKLTVINNDTENRYNHNWLISYFWEKSQLLMYTWGTLDNSEQLNDFLSIDQEEVKRRNNLFNELYTKQIIPLIRGILYRNLSNRFPDKLKHIT